MIKSSFSIHFLQFDELIDAIKSKEEKELKYVDKKNLMHPHVTKNRKLKELLKEYPDIMYSVSDDGCITIWGIQNLSKKPTRIAKCIIIMKVAKASLPQDSDFFKENVQIFSSSANINETSIYFPPEIHILTCNSFGELRIFALNLDEFFGGIKMNSHLRLIDSFCGHKSTIKSIIKHPNLDLIATMGNDGTVFVWKVWLPSVGLRIRKGLEKIDRIVLSDTNLKEGFNNYKSMNWLPCIPTLIILNNLYCVV
jgi:WD40 repeat protein